MGGQPSLQATETTPAGGTGGSPGVLTPTDLGEAAARQAADLR